MYVSPIQLVVECNHMSDISTQERQRFDRDGYLRVSGLADPTMLSAISAQVSAELASQPMELEIDVGYPGAPRSESDRGASTPRRLLAAYARDGAIQSWAGVPAPIISRLLDSPTVWLSQAHHNCVMTKYPSYSSDTLWHQDIRFWAFEPPHLVNCWLALGTEREENGGLRVIPGSHRWKLDPERLDQGCFLDPRHPENAAAIDASIQLDLEPGDALFFHAGLFHAATRNRTDSVKLSLVYSYHGAGTRPVPGTRSAALEEIRFDC